MTQERKPARMMMYGLPEDPAVLAAVGKIAIRHGQLDHALRMTVKTLANLEIQEAMDATARQGSRELRERVRKLARKRLGESPALAKLDALLERARRATENRNNTLHSLWAKELDGDHFIAGEGHKFGPIPQAAELEEIAEQLHKIALEINTERLDGFLCKALGIEPLGNPT